MLRLGAWRGISGNAASSLSENDINRVFVLANNAEKASSSKADIISRGNNGGGAIDDDAEITLSTSHIVRGICEQALAWRG